MKLYDLRTEYRVNPIGIGRIHPRFSWKMESKQADTVQKSCRIQVRTGKKWFGITARKARLPY